MALTWNGNDIVSLSQKPGQADLSGSVTLFLTNLLNPLDEFEVLGEVLSELRWIEVDQHEDYSFLDSLHRFNLLNT